MFALVQVHMLPNTHLSRVYEVDKTKRAEKGLP